MAENQYDIPQGTGPQVKNAAEITDKSPKGQGLVRRWITEIRSTQNRLVNYYDRADKIIARYRDERENTEGTNDTNVTRQRRMNVYWSMVQTERSHLYMEPGKPYVHRRFDDRDAAARDASMLLQRCLTFSHDESDVHYAMRAAVTNYQLAGRGVTWVRYSPQFELRTSENRTRLAEGEEPNKDDYPEGFEIGSDDEGDYVSEKYQAKVGERCEVANVNIKDFLHEMTSDWSHCKWVARRVAMTYDELKDRFGKEKADGIPAKAFRSTDTKSGENDNIPDDYKGLFTRADVWEIWDKEKRQVLWINTDYAESVLDETKDIYGLYDFFPCPRPLFGTLTPDSLIPVPDWYILQDAFEEMDRITERLKLLHEACRVAGVYDSSAGDDLKQLVTQTEENKLIPVDNWAMYQEAGGLRGIVSFLPLAEIIAVIKELMVARRTLSQELYEISGLADVTRGASDYRETAKAQEIKGDFATMRLRERQLLVAEHYREILQIKAEIIAKHYDDNEIMQIASARELFTKTVQPPAQPMPNGQAQQPGAAPMPPQLPPQQVFDQERFEAAVAVLREAGQRQFRIKVDTDTLGGARKNQEMQEKVQFLEAMGQFMNQAVTAAETVPNSAPLMAKLLMFGVRGFKVGRQMEQEIEETVQKLVTEGTGKPPESQQNGKSPEEIQLEQQKLMLEQERLQLEKQRLQIDMMNAQTQAQEKLGRLQVDAQSRSRDADQREAKIVNDAQRDMASIQQQQRATDVNAQIAIRSQDIQREKAGLDNQSAQQKDMLDLHKEELKIAEKERDRALHAAQFEIDTRADFEKQARELASKERVADKQAQRAQQNGSSNDA